jgi:hypothetical protein
MRKFSALLAAAFLAMSGSAVLADDKDRAGEKKDRDRMTDTQSEGQLGDLPPAGSPHRPDAVDESKHQRQPVGGRDDASKRHDMAGDRQDVSGKTGDKAAKFGASYPSKMSEINKHISFVDLYLNEAANNAKALSTLADAESGKRDSQLIQEGRKNLDGAIGNALTHLKHVRGFKSDLEMAPAMETPGTPGTSGTPTGSGTMGTGTGTTGTSETGATGTGTTGTSETGATGTGTTGTGATGTGTTGTGTMGTGTMGHGTMMGTHDKATNIAKLDELETHLKGARTAAKKLASAKMDTLSTSVDAVTTHLVAAQQTFRDLAKVTSYTLLEDTNLGTMPVRGGEGMPSGDIDRDPQRGTPGTTTPDIQSPPGTTTPDRTGTPGTQSPGSVSPDRSGTTPRPPTDREPTRPAPGGGY